MKLSPTATVSAAESCPPLEGIERVGSGSIARAPNGTRTPQEQHPCERSAAQGFGRNFGAVSTSFRRASTRFGFVSIKSRGGVDQPRVRVDGIWGLLFAKVRAGSAKFQLVASAAVGMRSSEVGLGVDQIRAGFVQSWMRSSQLGSD